MVVRRFLPSDSTSGFPCIIAFVDSTYGARRQRLCILDRERPYVAERADRPPIV